MKRCLHCLCVLALILLPGCADRAYLEEQQILLVLGMDMERDDTLVVYASSPVFSQEAQKKYNITSSDTKSFRQSRKILDSMSIGNIGAGKVQNFLIGKRLLEKRDAFHYLDSFFRDPKNEINGNVLVVNGNVRDIMNMNMKDKGRLGVVLREQVDNTYDNRQTVATTLQQFHRQINDPGLTPHMPQIRAGKNEIIVEGTALLSRKGRYVSSLNAEESSLLLLLQNDTGGTIPLTLVLPSKELRVQPEILRVTIGISKANPQISAKFKRNRFVFDIKMNVSMSIRERPFAFDTEKKVKLLERAIQKQLKRELDVLVKKLQKHKVDPIGLGTYAQVQQYNKWKKVQKNWGEAFSKADVNISLKAKILSFGIVK